VVKRATVQALPPDDPIRTAKRGNALIPRAEHQLRDDALKHDTCCRSLSRSFRRRRRIPPQYLSDCPVEEHVLVTG